MDNQTQNCPSCKGIDTITIESKTENGRLLLVISSCKTCNKLHCFEEGSNKLIEYIK